MFFPSREVLLTFSTTLHILKQKKEKKDISFKDDVTVLLLLGVFFML
jgi:hypothetical protein